MPIDVAEKDQHIQVLNSIVSRFGKVDVLVNGAGINSPTPFFDISLEQWRSVIDSQLTGTFLGCQVFGEHMVANQSGSIINISSASAGPPLSKAFAYSVSKAGILNLTQNLGREWGQQGVRVNAIRPGFFPTEWNVLVTLMNLLELYFGWHLMLQVLLLAQKLVLMVAFPV